MHSRHSRRVQRAATIIGLALAVFAITVQFVPRATAGGPAYSGPQTAATGPAYFGPAPNPIPYCENPTYFDPFPENVNPIGQISVTGSPNASVTTDGITMDFELTAEGDTLSQYPGFFPFGGEGVDTDQPKGVEMAAGDAATVTLSEPLFYSQWVFTDVDRVDEGFDVTPAWTDAGNPGAVAVFGGDANFEFSGTTNTTAQFNDSVGTPGEASESINGRVQVDFIGAVTGISMVRDPGSGQSGFAVGGGCSPIGVAKELTSGPTWNGTSYDVTYTLRVRNNLPSTATLQADVTNATGAAASSTTAGTIAGIDLTSVQLQDTLTDGAFDDISVVSLVNESGNVTINNGFDGDADPNLIAAGQVIPAETEETFVLTLQYSPAAAGPLGSACASTYTLQNSATVSATASGVQVEDLSDDGVDPDPGVDNGAGGVDDPSPVGFTCAPAGLEIVKTAVPGAGATCPTFDNGTIGDGTAVAVTEGDAVTYCITVRNSGPTNATGVEITDPQAPAGFDGSIATLGAGSEQTVSFELVVDDQTPTQNTATATGTGPQGALGPVSDTALISVSPPAMGAISISKTIVPASLSCDVAVEGADEFVVGEPGDAIRWCITITNTGNTALSNILLDDPLAGITDRDVLAVDGGGAPSLAAGNSIDIEIPGTVPAAGAVNTALVDATPSEADGTPLQGATPVNDSNTAEVGSTAVSLVKSVVAGAAGDCMAAVDQITTPAGTTVTYCFTATNDGSVDLAVADIVDTTLNITVMVPVADRILAPGASVTVSAEATATDLVNTAAVTGTPVDPQGDPIDDAPQPTDTDTAQVLTQTPTLDIVKTVVAGPSGTCPANVAAGVPGAGTPLMVNVGDTVTYCLNVANTGPLSVDNVTVSDPMAPGGFDGNLGTLAAGAEGATSFDLVVTSDTALTNTASVTGDDPAGGQLPPDTDTAVIERATPAPSVQITKTVVAAGGSCDDAVEGVDELVVASEGDAVTWCLTVSNNGNVPLTNVVVTDTPIGLDGVDVLTTYGGGASVLDVGASISFTVAGTIPDGGLSSDADVVGDPAEADGTPIDGATPVTDQNGAGVNEVAADVSVTKSVSNPGPVLPGTSLEYTIVVANAGPDAAENVSLTDVLPAGVDLLTLPSLDGWTCSELADGFSCTRAAAMPSGESETLTYTAVPTIQAPLAQALTNTVTVTTTTVDDDPTNNSDTSTTSVDLVPTDNPQVPEYPGPFTPPAEPPVPTPAPPLALTGSQSVLVASLSAFFLGIGGVMHVAGRRRADEHELG